MAVNYPLEPGDDDVMLSEINTTPLVDVMLVLLIIFLITIPVVSASVGVQLPREFNQLSQARPDNVIISITATNDTFWYDLPLPDRGELQSRLQALGKRQPQPEVHIRADAGADYAAVAKVVLAAQQAGIVRIGFLTEPPANR
jgi:biopolymer transport protein ExbD